MSAKGCLIAEAKVSDAEAYEVYKKLSGAAFGRTGEAFLRIASVSGGSQGPERGCRNEHAGCGRYL